ncbi:MAG: phosphoribosyltransferase family protein, partial [Gammaproteobacteria bacterium]
KYRGSGVVSGETLIGDVGGKSAVILDDLIGTGTTLGRAVAACHDHGASEIRAAASHGLFVGNAREVIDDTRLMQLVVTDTVPPFRLDPQIVHDKLTVVDAAGLFAAALRCMHEGGSITSLMEG